MNDELLFVDEPEDPLTNSVELDEETWKVLIVDDEPLALKVIESHFSKVPNLELVDSCQNAVEALQVLLNGSIDLVFLDVEMPEISGVELLKSMKQGPAVIFTTAYRDFALDAFELDAIDYLLKPINSRELINAVEKATNERSNNFINRLDTYIKNQNSHNQNKRIALQTTEGFYFYKVYLICYHSF